MSKIEDFLTKSEEQEIVNAIKEAELLSSGEIRVHLESELKKDVHERALEVFHMLEMGNTKLHNGVLFYVAIQSKAFAIYGDRGINKVVPESFWESTRDVMLSSFEKGDFKAGILKGITEAGIQLKEFYPRLDNDINELPDQISKG